MFAFELQLKADFWWPRQRLIHYAFFYLFRFLYIYTTKAIKLILVPSCQMSAAFTGCMERRAHCVWDGGFLALINNMLNERGFTYVNTRLKSCICSLIMNIYSTFIYYKCVILIKNVEKADFLKI